MIDENKNVKNIIITQIIFRYVEIRRDHHQIETSTSWEERMLAGLSALRKNQAESESESLSETSTAWEDRMLARETLSALPKNQEESESETSTAWEDRMLAREAGGRLTAVGTRRKEEDEEQEDEQRKEVKSILFVIKNITSRTTPY